MNETRVKTHLIITDIIDEYYVKWCGSISNTKPLIQNGKPVFVIRCKEGGVELNTTDVKYIETTAKKLTAPAGRKSFTTDTVRIFIKEYNGKEKMLGMVVHDRTKKYAPMYDKVGYKEI